jgi:hypothetical protein
MSNFLAIATVTAALRRIMLQVIPVDVNGADVTHVRPAEGQNTGLPNPLGVNIFLYQVTPNPHWRNNDLPTRRADGEIAQRPQAALNLHYLFSFYGNEGTMEPQRLLGSTAAFLHSQPLLTRARVEAAVNDATLELGDSDLADQIDIVRFTPLALSLEELSRLWSVFFQVKYVLSVAYQASVVLIEPKVTPRVALPTRDYNVRALPLDQPYIRRIISQSNESAPILPGDKVYIEGLRLQREITRVEIYGEDVPIDELTPTRIALTLPATLAAGVQRVQVRHGVRIGAPSEPHLTFSSNLGVFVLQPEITKTDTSYNIVISDVQETDPGVHSAKVVITVLPELTPRQQVTLEMLTIQGEVAHTFLSKPRPSDTDEATFLISGVAAGDYLFRVRVDGAESILELDNNQQPVAPKETIP